VVRRTGIFFLFNRALNQARADVAFEGYNGAGFVEWKRIFSACDGEDGGGIYEGLGEEGVRCGMVKLGSGGKGKLREPAVWCIEIKDTCVSHGCKEIAIMIVRVI